jgi:hypothetical protein
MVALLPRARGAFDQNDELSVHAAVLALGERLEPLEERRREP